MELEQALARASEALDRTTSGRETLSDVASDVVATARDPQLLASQPLTTSGSIRARRRAGRRGAKLRLGSQEHPVYRVSTFAMDRCHLPKGHVLWSERQLSLITMCSP
jgi:hypothetical protein